MPETTSYSVADVRAWALEQGLTVGTRGKIAADVTDAFNKAHGLA